MKPAATSIVTIPAAELPLAVLLRGAAEDQAARHLARALELPLLRDTAGHTGAVLTWTAQGLALWDCRLRRARPLTVELLPAGLLQQRLPRPRRGVLAQAIGRAPALVVDATAGWGGDAALLLSMGYPLTLVERDRVMGQLLADGVARARRLVHRRRLPLRIPELVVQDAREYLSGLSTPPDCIYLDPMFPLKRRESALAKRPLRLLRELVGTDADSQELLAVARAVARRRVVVKRPDHTPPLAPDPQDSYRGKLVRYDVYLRSGSRR